MNINIKKDYSSIKDFMMKNTSLLHLFFTNNQNNIKEYKKCGIQNFLCHFEDHKDKKHQVGVKELVGFYVCQKYEETGTAIEYLMKVENIRYSDAISLLCAIYKFKIDNKNPEVSKLDPDIIKKYQISLVSEEFKKYIIKSDVLYKQKNNIEVDDLIIISKVFDINKRILNDEYIHINNRL